MLGETSWSSDKPDHEVEGTSIDYTAENKNKPSQFRPPFWASKYNKTQFQYRGVSGDTPQGYWWNEVSWPYNTITDGASFFRTRISLVRE